MNLSSKEVVFDPASVADHTWESESFAVTVVMASPRLYAAYLRRTKDRRAD